MSRPQISERHVGRTHRSVFLPANLWTVSAGGGLVSGGFITLALGEYVGVPFVPPYDLDPSFPVKFRVHFNPAAAQTQSFLLKTTLSNNDGTGEAYVSDPSAPTALTTPIPDVTTTAPMNAMGCVSGIGSLTLASTTRRDWSAGLWLYGATAANPPSITGVEIAYVPLTAGITGAAAEIADAWSV